MRERERNGHELFMNASIKRRQNESERGGETKEMAAATDCTSLRGAPLPKSILFSCPPSLSISFCLPRANYLLSFSSHLLQINVAKKENILATHTQKKKGNEKGLHGSQLTFPSSLCSWCVPSEGRRSPKTGVKLFLYALMSISICQYEQFSFPQGKTRPAKMFCH